MATSDNRSLTANELVIAFLIALGVVLGVFGLPDVPPLGNVIYRVACAVSVVGNIWWLYRKPRRNAH